VQRKGAKVKGKIIVLIPTVMLASSFLASPALADTKSPPSASSSDVREVYKLALDKFKNDLSIYEEKRREINHNFKDAIDKALFDAKSAVAGIQSQIQKRQSISARQNAVMVAIATRDAAIESLGLPPVAPTPPAKSAKFEKDKKSKFPVSVTPPQ
jgi:hypothetical protein